MMAFFLVLWIINATDKNTKTIIARYFNPVKLENAAKSKKGIHGGAQPTKRQGCREGCGRFERRCARNK
jgi:chemotaxis protein MotB